MPAIELTKPPPHRLGGVRLDEIAKRIADGSTIEAEAAALHTHPFFLETYLAPIAAMVAEIKAERNKVS
jgi:hypothetical protein